MNSWMGFCLYVAGGIFIQDLKSGMSMYELLSLCICIFRELQIMQFPPCPRMAILLHAVLSFNNIDLIVSRSATASKRGESRIPSSCYARHWG
jgi:hypothetical protein